MAITGGNVAAASVAKTLGAGVAPPKIRVAGIGQGRAHKFVRAGRILAVTKQRGFGRMLHRRGFGRNGHGLPGGIALAFALPVTDVARVVVIAGVRVCAPVGAAVEQRTLLDSGTCLPLPQYPGHHAVRAIFIRREIPTIKDAARAVEIAGERIKV